MPVTFFFSVPTSVFPDLVFLPFSFLNSLLTPHLYSDGRFLLPSQASPTNCGREFLHVSFFAIPVSPLPFLRPLYGHNPRRFLESLPLSRRRHRTGLLLSPYFRRRQMYSRAFSPTLFDRLLMFYFRLVRPPYRDHVAPPMSVFWLSKQSFFGDGL